MKSLFDKLDNEEVIKRINYLNHSAPAQWGKMNVTQMLAHCQVPLKVSYEEIVLRKSIMGFLFGKMAKKKILSDKPLRKNLPTFREAKIKTTRDFHTEKEQLATYVARMTQGPQVLTKKPHPFFGPLTTEEWDRLQYKHLDHHLKQFGV
jgi:hypothetical protein